MNHNHGGATAHPTASQWLSGKRNAGSPHTGTVALTERNIHAQLGVGRTYLYQLIKHGKVRTVKLGRRTLVPHDELVRYVASLTRGTVGDGE